MSEFPLVDERQLQGLVRFFQALLLPAQHADPTAPMPPPAVMVTVYEPAEAPTATAAWLGDIQARVTLPDGQRPTLRCPDLLWYLVTQPALIRGVEPVTPSLAFILFINDWLWAWDFTPLGAAPAGGLAQPLLNWGPEPRRERRRRAFGALSAAERAQVLHDTVTDYLLEPGRLRIPMRGLLHAGWHDVGTGEIRRPSQMLRSFDAALGRRRKAATPASALTSADHGQYLVATAPPSSDDMEEFIQHITAPLPPQERFATQHWLWAAHLRLEFTAYCAQHGLDYDTTLRAATRGRRRLLNTR